MKNEYKISSFSYSDQHKNWIDRTVIVFKNKQSVIEYYCVPDKWDCSRVPKLFRGSIEKILDRKIRN